MEQRQSELCTYINEQFLQIKSSESTKQLVDFQAMNKYLFMALSPQKQKELGRIIANPRKLNVQAVYSDYRDKLDEILASEWTIGKAINAYTHMFGYFREKLTVEEKKRFNEVIKQLKHGEIGESVIKTMINHWANEYEESYIQSQTLLLDFLGI